MEKAMHFSTHPVLAAGWPKSVPSTSSVAPYYRLNVFPIEVPPLRERSDDVLMLLEYFVHRFGRKVGKEFKRLDKHTL